MRRIIKQSKIIIAICSIFLLSGCSSIDTQAEFSSATPRSSSDLVVPPGLTAPEVNSNYKMLSNNPGETGYELNKIKDMQITQAGSERWLVVKNKSVDQVWPMMLAYLNQMGLVTKYQNKSVGLIQTDWATRNNNVPQTVIRGFFSWVGWGNMYSMPSQYMFRVNLWQNESDTQVFVTDYQMNEVYSNCSQPHNSSVEPSDNERTKWVAMPPNPQLELEFLLNFMAFSGLPNNEVKKIVTKFTAESATLPVMAQLQGTQLVLFDQFDRAWWRTGLALERSGLGVTDKNRSEGIYYVYPLQSQIDNPDPGFLARWFGNDSNNLQLPKAKYIVKLTTSNNQTILTMSLAPGATDKDFASNQKKYLNALLKQLQ